MIAFLMGMFFSTQAADHVKGNGKLSTKKITIDDFNAIKFDGVIDFNYEQSESTPHIEITVDENLHPYVNIDIQDRVLTVGFKGAKVDHFTKFIVKTNSKWLKEVKAAGNANFMINSSLTGDEVKIKAAGGIRTLDTALRMIELGVSRIGSTASVSIVEELKHRL